MTLRRPDEMPGQTDPLPANPAPLYGFKLMDPVGDTHQIATAMLHWKGFKMRADGAGGRWSPRRVNPSPAKRGFHFYSTIPSLAQSMPAGRPIDLWLVEVDGQRIESRMTKGLWVAERMRLVNKVMVTAPYLASFALGPRVIREILSAKLTSLDALVGAAKIDGRIK